MRLERISSVSESNTFVVTSGALRVTDPCYDMDTWCSGQLDNVRNGIWHAHVGYHKDELDMKMRAEWRNNYVQKMNEMASEFMKEYIAQEIARIDKDGAAYLGRVAYLHIVSIEAERHFDHMAEFDSTWENSNVHVGVDSGQAGFFDLALFGQVCESEPVKDKFYDEVCNLTLDDNQWGVHSIGAVSSSGYGDGSYECLVRRVDGQVVEAIIVYIAEYEEEEEGEENA